VELTDDPAVVNDCRNFYKVEKWTKDGTKVDRLLHADKQPSRRRIGYMMQGCWVSQHPTAPALAVPRSAILAPSAYSFGGISPPLSDRAAAMVVAAAAAAIIIIAAREDQALTADQAATDAPSTLCRLISVSVDLLPSE
jgi:hypothetical protein